METQIGDNGEIPLVFVNGGSGDAEENHEIKTTRERRRSRIMSGVFMGSGTGEEGQEYRKVGTKTLSCTLIHQILGVVRFECRPSLPSDQGMRNYEKRRGKKQGNQQNMSEKLWHNGKISIQLKKVNKELYMTSNKEGGGGVGERLRKRKIKEKSR